MAYIEAMSFKNAEIDIEHILSHPSRWPVFVHFMTATLCLGFSAIYHLFFVYSDNVSKILARLDYAGIILLIYGSGVSPVHYIFACPSVKTYQITYQVVGLVSSLAAFTFTLLPVFYTPKFRTFRTLMFVGLGL